VLGFRADAGSVWMRHLSDRTDARTRRFVGLTSEAGLFGLDVMLRGHNMRLVYLAEHRPVDGAYVHSVRLPQRASWGAEAATLAMRVPAGGYRPLPAALGPSLQEAAPEQLTLVSWVIAA
jgi:hypothetical protein